MNEYAKYVQDTLPTRDMLEQVAEEAAELSQAALKLIRAYGLSEDPTPTTCEQALSDFSEETQDLFCVLRLVFPDSRWECITNIDDYPKYRRWARRIEDMKKLKRERGKEGKRCRVMSNYVNRLNDEALRTLFRLFAIADKENTEVDIGNIKRVEIIREEGKVSLKGRINYRRSVWGFVYEVNKNITYILTDFLARGTKNNAAYNDAITGTYRVFMQTIFGQGYTEDFLLNNSDNTKEMKENG